MQFQFQSKDCRTSLFPTTLRSPPTTSACWGRTPSESLSSTDLCWPSSSLWASWWSPTCWLSRCYAKRSISWSQRSLVAPATRQSPWSSRGSRLRPRLPSSSTCWKTDRPERREKCTRASERTFRPEMIRLSEGCRRWARNQCRLWATSSAPQRCWASYSSCSWWCGVLSLSPTSPLRYARAAMVKWLAASWKSLSGWVMCHRASTRWSTPYLIKLSGKPSRDTSPAITKTALVTRRSGNRGRRSRRETLQGFHWELPWRRTRNASWGEGWKTAAKARGGSSKERHSSRLTVLHWTQCFWLKMKGASGRKMSAVFRDGRGTKETLPFLMSALPGHDNPENLSRRSRASGFL